MQISHSRLSTNLLPSPQANAFGMVSIGTDYQTVIHQAKLLNGVQSWYTYDPVIVSTPGERLNQIYLVKMGQANDWQYQQWLNIINSIKAGKFPVLLYSGSQWILGNEPNNQGQDNQSPQDYATQLHDTVQLIKSVDPEAVIIGGSTLNWTAGTNGTGSRFVSGKTWFTQMVTAYQIQYPNERFPLDKIMLHTSKIDWINLPMIDAQQDIQQIVNLRTTLDSDPRLSHLPIWVEFAILWGFDGFTFLPTTDGTTKIEPTGTLRTDLMQTYITQLVTYMHSHSRDLKIERWFPYVNYGLPEPYNAGEYAGLSLFTTNDTNGQLTDVGNKYARLKQMS